MQIKAGDYCDTGVMICRAEPNGPGEFHVGCHRVDSAGRYVRTGEQCVLRIVFVSDTPPQVCPELKAGGRYETVKPDGTPGPVVELHQTSFSVEGIRDYFCFSSAIKNDTLYITAGGLCVGNCEPGNRYQITREYVEPKPPSLAERLEKWRNDASKSYAEIGSIISDVRKLEASK